MDLPEGLVHAEGFLSEEEERQIAGRITDMELSPVVIQGTPSRRRVTHFGWDYRYDQRSIDRAEPLPEFLRPLRERAAAFAGVEPERLEQVLVARYPPGAGIGWHRDAPMFGRVVGVSLLSSSVLKLRPLPVKGEKAGRGKTIDLPLLSRSIYLLSGAARTRWQHSIPPVKTERLSITFRTVRDSFRK